MASGKQHHINAAALHQKAADQHTAAANAHIVAAVPNSAAANKPAAKLDLTAAKQHQKAAASHSAASAAQQAAASQSSQRTTKRQNASTASQKAGVKSATAGAATQQAVAADTASPPSTDPTQQAAAQNGVTQGQLAQQSSNQAVTTGAQAAQDGQAASQIGDSDGGWINSIVERLGLTGVTKTMVDHNRFFTIALIIAVIIFVFFYGTEPKTENPFYPDASGKCCLVVQSTSDKNPSDLDAALANDPDLAPLNPRDFFTQKMVTQADLQTEVTNYLNAGTAKITLLQSDLKTKSQQVANAIEQIEAQKAAISAAVTTLGALATASAPVTGPIGPLIGIVTGLLTTGLAADNARKTSVASQNPGAEQSTE